MMDTEHTEDYVNVLRYCKVRKTIPAIMVQNLAKEIPEYRVTIYLINIHVKYKYMLSGIIVLIDFYTYYVGYSIIPVQTR